MKKTRVPPSLLLAICVALLSPATALGATRSGSGSDPSGDAEPQHDIQRMSATYKTGGAVEASLSLGLAPQAGSLIAVVFSTQAQGGKCFSDNALVLGYLPGPGKAFAAVENKRFKARANVKDQRITLTVDRRQLAGKPFNCADFAAGPEDAEVASDLLDRPIRLR